MYMIDDIDIKHRNFFHVLEAVKGLREESGLGDIEIASGFADATSGLTALQDPARLFEIIKDQDAILLIDLDMPGTKSTADDLLSLLDSAEPGYRKRVELEYSRIEDQHRLDNYHLAFVLLSICRSNHSPCLLVTTVAKAKTVDHLLKIGLAQKSASYFPDQTELSKDAESIQTVARDLIGLMNPLTVLADRTRLWFASSSWIGDNLPHDVTFPGAKNIDDTLAAKHRSAVRKVFSWFPDHWWMRKDSSGNVLSEFDQEAIQSLHRCLKTVCGSSARWTGGEKDLNLGGAYLLFLIAIRQQFPLLTAGPRYYLPDFCSLMGDAGKPLPFLPGQWQPDAAATTRSLFDLFGEISVLKDSNPRKCSVQWIAGPQRGSHSFTALLDWSTDQRKDFGSALSNHIRAGTDVTGLEAIKLPRGKAVGSLLRFVVNSQMRTEGFGALGSISLADDGILQVGR
jgi:hypothetical protein